jgi:hypothetical protein
MFHEEKIIKGILHWRSIPNGEWTPYTAEQMTKKFLELTQRLAE